MSDNNKVKPDKMSTRERIIEEALTLFSKKGYHGTSVKSIADAVGIKDSSLYKHFISKEEIFRTIVDEMAHRMQAMSQSYGLPDDDEMEEAVDLYRSLTLPDLLTLSKNIFLYYLKDEFAARFRRMLTIEQYQDEEIYSVYRKIFMESAISYQTDLFREMIRRGFFINADAEIMALNFYSPIFFLLNKYDQEPDKEEEAIGVIDKHVREFAKIYQKKSASSGKTV